MNDFNIKFDNSRGHLRLKTCETIPLFRYLMFRFSDCFTFVSFLCSTCVTSSLNFTGWSTKSTRKHLVLFRWFGDNYYPSCTVFWKRCFSSQHPIKTQSNMTMYRELLRSRELWREDMWCKLNFPEERELITKEWLKNSGFVRLRRATHSLF